MGLRRSWPHHIDQQHRARKYTLAAPADRMGAIHEKTYKNSYANQDVMLYRHPGPEAVL